MPLGEWYSIREVCQETRLSYSQVIRWTRRQFRSAEPPGWLVRTTRGIMVHQEGLDVLRGWLRREIPSAAPRATPKTGGQ
mgnify:CR=1 FL=1